MKINNKNIFELHDYRYLITQSNLRLFLTSQELKKTNICKF